MIDPDKLPGGSDMETREAVWNELKNSLEQFVDLQNRQDAKLSDIELLRNKIEMLESRLNQIVKTEGK
jgi:hypothetical protein